MAKKSNASAKAGADKKSQILGAMLRQAAFDGWTETAYTDALRQTKTTAAEAARHFPGGIADIVDAFVASIDGAMHKRVKAETGFHRKRVRDKIAFAVRARLEAMTPHRDAVRRLMAWYALPHHMPAGVSRFYKTVDMIWQIAGDTSNDYNFYTKRILLAAVLKATILYWLGDKSQQCSATWDFLDRRIGDVMKLGKTIGLVKEFKPSELADMLRNRLRKAI